MVAQTSKFIKFIRDDCRKYNTYVCFTKWKSLKDEDCEYDSIEGYFDTPRRNKRGKIKIAAGVPTSVWLHTLAHEYAHFEYWRKNNKFRKSYILDEIRTEERALELLEEWKLPINMKVRRKQSKIYLDSIKSN